MANTSVCIPYGESHPFNVGRLIIVKAPMFAGKSSYLIQKLTRFADTGCKVLYINHSIDVRDTKGGDNMVSTHSSQFKHLSDRVDVIKSNKLADIDVSGYDVVGIDESQFFDDLLSVIEWVDKKHIYVFCAGLIGDFNRNKFGKMLDLEPFADESISLRAKCKKCLQELSHDGRIQIRHNMIPDAPFTGKISRNTDDESNIIDVGGEDKYIPLCRFHYLSLNKK